MAYYKKNYHKYNETNKRFTVTLTIPRVEHLTASLQRPESLRVSLHVGYATR